jgi:hypothetical protein
MINGLLQTCSNISFPEYGAPKAIEAKDRSYPHMKAMMYNNLNSEDGHLLRGEVVVILRFYSCASETGSLCRTYDYLGKLLLRLRFVGETEAECEHIGSSFLLHMALSILGSLKHISMATRWVMQIIWCVIKSVSAKVYPDIFGGTVESN